MRVLVSAASKHGSTQQIAAAIAEGLRGRGIEADVLEVGAITSLEGYDAAVLGSAVYAGHWMKPMLELLEANAAELQERPVWLFSSGPLGAPEAKPADQPVDVAKALELSGARVHRIFVGKLDRAELGFAERAIVKAVKVPYGDFRDWEAIDAFAAEIAAALAVAEPAVAISAS